MPTPPLRVLIVDDEPMIQEVLREYLTGDGHQVESASNGGEALERLRAVHFDLVITDRVMPGMNGDQLALEIKRISPQIPVFLLTGFCDTMVAEGKRPEGVDQILNKPISLQSLRAALAAA
jgi:CheY-like chemotaxis protein